MSTYGEQLRAKGLNFGTPRKPRTSVDRGSDTKKTEVIHEVTGQTGGFQTEHKSGRVDATITHYTTEVP